MNKLKYFLLGLPALAMLNSYAVDITLPEEVSSTISSAQNALLTAGGIIIVLAVVAMAIRWVRALFV